MTYHRQSSLRTDDDGVEKSEHIELVLACESMQQAHDIADDLLKKNLVAHAEFLPILRHGEAHGAQLIVRTKPGVANEIEAFAARYGRGVVQI